jgi:ribosomal protein S18 acetylase RimI-like enzyme
VKIRDAAPDEMSIVGEIRIAAYEADGFISSDSGYASTLRGLGADGNGRVLVATMPTTEQIVGTIMLQTWPHTGPVVAGPDEAEIRALAVRPGIQRMGIGRTLLKHALERAAALRIRSLVLCTEPAMHVAHRLYEQAGFVRLPERDWSPSPGTTLLVYGLKLDANAQRT